MVKAALCSMKARDSDLALSSSGELIDKSKSKFLQCKTLMSTKKFKENLPLHAYMKTRVLI